MKLKIAHLGDAHLGKKQYGLKQRDEDFRNAVTHCFQSAFAKKVDVIILPGDVFDGPKPNATDVRHLVDLVNLAKSRGITVIGINGNHDPSADTSWLNVCDILTFNNEHNPATVKGYTIYGINNARSNAFMTELSTMVTSLHDRGQKLDVLIIHQSVAELCGFSGADLTAKSISEVISQLDVKYVAMGDIHSYALQEFGGTTFCYPGSCEVTSLNEDFSKYWVEVDIDDGKVTTTKNLIPTRTITRFTIRTYESIAEMVDQIKSGCLNHLVVVDVCTTVPSGYQVVMSMLNELGVMSRVHKVMLAGVEGQSYVVAPELTVAEWSRVESLGLVSAAISKYYEKQSNEYQLIERCLNAPDSVNNICEEWMKSGN